MGSGPNWYQTGNKTYTKRHQILHRKRISLLTSLKVPSPVCVLQTRRKRRREGGGEGAMELNFEVLRMQK